MEKDRAKSSDEGLVRSRSIDQFKFVLMIFSVFQDRKFSYFPSACIKVNWIGGCYFSLLADFGDGNSGNEFNLQTEELPSPLLLPMKIYFPLPRRRRLRAVPMPKGRKGLDRVNGREGEA